MTPNDQRRLLIVAALATLSPAAMRHVRKTGLGGAATLAAVTAAAIAARRAGPAARWLARHAGRSRWRWRLAAGLAGLARHRPRPRPGPAPPAPSRPTPPPHPPPPPPPVRLPATPLP